MVCARFRFRPAPSAPRLCASATPARPERPELYANGLVTATAAAALTVRKCHACHVGVRCMRRVTVAASALASPTVQKCLAWHVGVPPVNGIRTVEWFRPPPSLARLCASAAPVTSESLQRYAHKFRFWAAPWLPRNCARFQRHRPPDCAQMPRLSRRNALWTVCAQFRFRPAALSPPRLCASATPVTSECPL
jgi:hypothetical protein